LVFDPGAIDDPALVDAIAAAARLALVNARLRAQDALQLDELRASRRRLVEAADGERARLERRLHDGAARRLEAFAATLERARDVVCAVRIGGDLLRGRVEDDGIGGADPAAGSGLRGLADRVQALGGDLRIVSPAGGGTRVTAELPISARPATSGDP